jgi:hypothetical protein
VVTFGGARTDFTVVSSRQIIAVAPPHPGAGVAEVAVTDGTLTSARVPGAAAARFTYDGCGAPSSGGRLAYPAGYSLIGLPAGTAVPADSLLYGWQDRGGGATYSAQDPGAGVGAGQGYWAWVRCTRVVSPAAGGVSATAPLAAGHASMVGNPSAADPATVSGHDFAATWDPSLNGGAGGYHISAYRAVQALPVGGGAWVFSYASTTVSIHTGG